MVKSALSTVASFDEHWIHPKFAENLLAASTEQQAQMAAMEWESKGEIDEAGNCHLCNTPIKTGVLLRNNQNGNILIVGKVCHKKLLELIRTAHISSPRPFSRTQVKNLKRYTNQILDHTVLGWFDEQAQAGLLSVQLLGILELIKVLGYAPSRDAVDALVEYYRQTRRFPVRIVVIDAWRIRDLPHQNLLPDTMTIAQGERMNRIFDKWAHRLERKRAQRRYSELIKKLCSRSDMDVDDSAVAVLENIEV